MDENIKNMLDMLPRDEICIELFRMVEGFAKKHIRSANILHQNNLFNPSDYASNFILYLKKNLGARDIGAENDLRRLFKKWITINNNPERHELWCIVSGALRALEKEGKCERLPKYKTNNNSTDWFSPKFKGKQFNPRTYEAKKRDIPTFIPMKIKGDSKKKAKIIPPESAKKLVALLLESVEGKIPMGRIVDYAANHVVLNPYRQEKTKEQGDDTDGEYNTTRAKSDAEYVYIGEEAENRADIIWSSLSKRNKAHKILCLYIIPKYILSSDVKLDDFGSSKTVDSIKTDVFDVLRQNFHLERLTTGNTTSEEDVFLLNEVVSKTIEIINRRCSENGYDSSLSINRDKAKQ